VTILSVLSEKEDHLSLEAHTDDSEKEHTESQKLDPRYLVVRVQVKYEHVIHLVNLEDSGCKGCSQDNKYNHK
jgi:hypothetical protein